MLVSGTASVSAQGVSDTDSNATVNLPEITQSDIDTLLGSSKFQTDSISTYQTYIYEIDSSESLKDFVDSVNKGGLGYSGKTVNLNSDIIWTDS